MKSCEKRLGRLRQKDIERSHEFKRVYSQGQGGGGGAGITPIDKFLL